MEKKRTVGLLFRFADGCVFQTEEARNYFPKSVQNKSAIILNPIAEVFYKTSHNNDTHKIVTFLLP